MKDEEILSKLNMMYSCLAPDDFSSIKKELEKEKKEEVKMKTKRRFTILGPALAIAVVVICIIVGSNLERHTSLVAIDVNPSIELEVDDKEKIKEYRAANDDAKKILENIELKDVDLTTGMYAIIGSMLKNGYIDELKNSILITVQDKDTEKATNLKTKINTTIDEILKNYNLDASILSQSVSATDDLEKKAESYGISLGKAQLIEEIVAKNPLYTFDELSKLDIQELNLLLTTRKTDKENTTDLTVTGTASEGEYIGRTKAQEIAVNHAKVSSSKVSNVDIEFDYDDGIMVYDVEFDVGNVEYDYEIEAKTGKILKSNKEGDDDNKGQSSTTGSSSSNSTKTKDEALNKALSHAGVNRDSIYDLSIELDDEKGKRVYEIDFETSTHEYEYVIDASNLDVLDSEKERKDD